MYKQKKAIAFVTAMILAVGSKGVMTDAAIKSGQGVYGLNMYGHKEDSGTYNSMDGIWNSSLVASGKVATMRISFNKPALASVSVDAYGVDKDGNAIYDGNSGSGTSSAIATATLEYDITRAYGHAYLNSASVSYLVIQ